MSAHSTHRGRSVSRSTRAGRAALLLALTVLVGGCASWHATEQTPQQVFAGERPTKVRVTTTDGEQTVLAQPRVLGEVLAGYDDECASSLGIDTGRCEEVGIAVFEISVFELRRRGAVAIILPGLGGLLAVWLLANR